jgi:hypothetical protein
LGFHSPFDEDDDRDEDEADDDDEDDNAARDALAGVNSTRAENVNF